MYSVATNFKERYRYRNHLTSFRHENRRNETELSKQVWTLKDANRSFHVQGKVLSNCKPYDKASKNCNLCLQEKKINICKTQLCTLNKNRFTLRNFRITYATQRNRTDPEKPIGEPLYLRVDFVSIYKVFNHSASATSLSQSHIQFPNFVSIENF